YIRLAAQTADPLQLPKDPLKRLGILHSFPDWIVQLWRFQLSLAETEELCIWFNQPPTIDLRVNILRTSIEEVELALKANNLAITRLASLPQALRITGGTGSVQKLSGFKEGWWTVQDSSAQLVSHILAPQPGETIIDACAAPGGKTTHIAELMADQGKIWACDRAVKRLKKVTENTQRLRLNSISLCPGDSRSFEQFEQVADRVLVDAPCSGLGTLHRRPDLRWRQTPQKVQDLTLLQGQIIEGAAKWVKPGGILVYATCTLNSSENEAVIDSFLSSHPNWEIEPPANNFLATPRGWLKIWPHRQEQDGFFMVKLRQG
ncbi:MAG: 16S rRNA (cytosine(967)-C(5))-methyltransferase RsmB, partial [Spirulinaceae cyanobacterium]